MNVLKQTKNRNKFYALALAMVMIIMSIMPAQAFAWSFLHNPEDTGLVYLYFGDPDYDEVPPESLMQFIKTSNSPLTYHAYYSGNDKTDYYPDRLLLVVKPKSGGLSTTIVTETGVNATIPVGTVGVYDIEISKTANTREFEFSATSGSTQTIIITFDQPKDIKTGTSNLFAYLPAPAQFVNEGMGTGGWGDAYSAAGDLKFGGDPTGTGVSLGAFGGYTVFDFGSTGIVNDPNNKYGADFIVYGNAFWANSEAGAVQVAQDTNNDGIPDAWYDIAGSDYYKSTVIRDYKATYADPNPEVNTLASVPFVEDDTINDISPQDWTGINGLVVKNSYHNHSWFPLAVNYFANRNINSKTCQPVDMINVLDFVKRATLDPNDDPIDVEYTDGTTELAEDTSLLYFEGVKYVSDGTKTNNQQFVFGYADVHPNRTSDFTKAYNPYSLDAVTNNTQYNTATTGTGGGDPIDISWAVNSNGEPVNLNKIRFVRVYTGVQQMNGAFGEISTEVLGLKPNTATGTGSASSPAIKINGNNLSFYVTGGTIQNMGTVNVKTYASSITLSVTSGEDHVYMNDVYGSSQTISSIPISGYKEVRVIVQDGDGSPYIILLKITQ